MDPDACLALLKEALAQGRPADAAQHRADLNEWVDGGGFPPKDVYWRMY